MSLRMRCSTSDSSSSACLSSVLMRIVEAMRKASGPGSSMLAAAISSSSGRYGTRATIFENLLSREARRASISLLSAVTSSILVMSATR